MRTAELSAVEFLTTILRDEFKDEICVVSSFGAESAVLLHMVAQIDPTTPVIFLNTGKLLEKPCVTEIVCKRFLA